MFNDIARVLEPFRVSERYHSFLTKRRKIHDSGASKVRRRLKYPKKCRAAIVGLGGVGKSLAHLLKMFPGGLTELRLCNRSDPMGIVEELSHIPTRVNVLGFEGEKLLAEGLSDADIVVMSAGVSRKKDEPRQKLFADNASICANVMEMCADNCPEALISIISNPVDSLIPVAAEVLKNCGVYRPGRLFGICYIDQMRAQRYYADVIGAEPRKTYVPVVGGHSETTMVPLFSRARPVSSISSEEVAELIRIVRSAGTRVVKAKRGGGGSTYSMASAAMFFIHKLCRAIRHEPHVIASAYVESNVTDARYFSNELLLGPCGIEKNFGYGRVTEFEQKLIDEALPTLQSSIQMGEEYVIKSKGGNN